MFEEIEGVLCFDELSPSAQFKFYLVYRIYAADGVADN
jgi:hypothetical protein